MEETRGVLFLAEPLCAAALPQKQWKFPHEALVFDENERLLPQAQEALWRLRGRCGWVCVAASGAAAGVAAALAAQLPVDRLALSDSALFGGRGPRLSREMARMRRFARRNLALVASELLLLDATVGEISGFVRVLNRGRVCALETGAPPDAPWAHSVALLCAPWSRVNENNLLIPRKCV